MILVVFGKTHTTLVPWRDLVRTASRVATVLPGAGGDAARPPSAVSLVHQDDLHVDSHELKCVEYELNRLAADERPAVALRFEPLREAVRREEAFLIVDHNHITISTDETRAAIGRSIAEVAGPARFDLREIETVSVFRGDSSIILPNPLSRHSASLWLARPDGQAGVGSITKR